MPRLAAGRGPRGYRHTDGSCPAWLAGSSWNVEWPTSKWPCRQAWRASSMAALRPLASTPGSTTTCAESTGRPEVIVQACRSCTPTTPSSAVRWVRTSVRSMPRGLASSSTSTASRSSRQARGRMSSATASEAIGSIRVNPVAAITIPVPITAIAPKVSEATSRKAPRTFMLSACPCRSRNRDTPLPASATTPKTIMSPGVTSGGAANRRMASTPMNTAMPSSSSALTVAARISARAYPYVARSVAGLVATYAASSDSPTPAASAAMCAASASSTREPLTSAPHTSAMAIVAVIASTAPSLPRYRPVAVTAPGPWPCPDPIAAFPFRRCLALHCQAKAALYPGFFPEGRISVPDSRGSPGPPSAMCRAGRRGSVAELLVPGVGRGLAGGEEFVSGVDHDGPARADADGAAEPDPGPADDARDVGAAIEQRGQVTGRVGDLAGQYRTP